jgi:hypothetical protein
VSEEFRLTYYGPADGAPTNDVLHTWAFQAPGGVKHLVRATHLTVAMDGALVFTDKTRGGRPVVFAQAPGEWSQLRIQ